MLEGVLADPRAGTARVRFAPRRARFVRLQQTGAHPDLGWVVAELKIYGSAGA
jgi:hypothetical protein